MRRTLQGSTRRELLVGAAVALAILAAAWMPGWHPGTAAALVGLWVALQATARRPRVAGHPASPPSTRANRHG